MVAVSFALAREMEIADALIELNERKREMLLSDSWEGLLGLMERERDLLLELLRLEEGRSGEGEPAEAREALALKLLRLRALCLSNGKLARDLARYREALIGEIRAILARERGSSSFEMSL